MKQLLLPCLPNSEYLYALNWDFGVENTAHEEKCLCLCVWTTPRSGEDPSTLILLSLPLPHVSVSSPSAHLAWLTKRICRGLTILTIMRFVPRGSLQRQFQCSCYSTCLWTEHATSRAVTLTLYLDVEVQSIPESHMEVIPNLWDCSDCISWLQE